ncbi:MAG TPA: Nramp family divalent metal transporter [Pirellulales bacterium]|jgi:hypothetical protein|nr:Nramp family divalent metal transporter [Pirellulales bacterium]
MSHTATAPADHPASTSAPKQQAPYPGTHVMPHWNVGRLPDAPPFSWKNWTAMVGPGLVMGAAAIGGGEWLTGPLVTAKYGGALFWLATISILAQVVYNCEISRYTLYCGEPIFTGIFRVPPGPMLWVWVYILADFGSLLPYLAVSSATPVAMVYLKRLPQPDTIASDWWLLKGLSCAIFAGGIGALAFGGKVYTMLKWIMSFKLVLVISFLAYLALFYSTADTWWEICSGFVRFGDVPVEGITGPDGLVEPGTNIANVFQSLWQGNGVPSIDLKYLGFIALMVAISGSGGLTNTNISGYTRDQGWGMGSHVGAIPSVVGGKDLQLSHVGTAFIPDTESMPRWRRWLHHVRREQLAVWMPACFIGLALPSMLSMQFLPRGTNAAGWTAAGATAEHVGDAVEAVHPGWGHLFWYLTLLCGFLVLSTSMISTSDGAMRRWVDLVWTGLPAMRRVEPHKIRYLYFGVLCGFMALGLFNLCFVNAAYLMEWAANLYNFAFGISCWHVLAVNTLLLPKELRPGWPVRIALALGGLFFLTFAGIYTYDFMTKPAA